MTLVKEAPARPAEKRAGRLAAAAAAELREAEHLREPVDPAAAVNPAVATGPVEVHSYLMPSTSNLCSSLFRTRATASMKSCGLSKNSLSRPHCFKTSKIVDRVSSVSFCRYARMSGRPRTRVPTVSVERDTV